MRALGLLLVGIWSLVGCSKATDGDPKAKAEAAPAEVKEDNRIRCQVSGMKDFAPVCTRERASGPDGPIWIIRHPDGGFRRFVLLDKGMRIATADGAEEVKAEQRGAFLEVRVADDRYLIAAAAHDPIR